MKYTYYTGANLTPRQLAERAVIVAEALEDSLEVWEKNAARGDWVSCNTYRAMICATDTRSDIRIEKKPFAWARVGGEDSSTSMPPTRFSADKSTVEAWCHDFGGELKPLYLGDDDEC